MPCFCTATYKDPGQDCLPNFSSAITADNTQYISKFIFSWPRQLITFIGILGIQFRSLWHWYIFNLGGFLGYVFWDGH
ncbi:hypothetical protein FGO68_gene11932 [Halteria grandinella]|uniref:Uncharacterized protein n=1 Tax=Halteria grandinella TaxID=5974 RepID=A0A8J8NA05_HALGN|nr:hypothetical protein FGO68_gene11932 [Halteria grandinella]